MNNTVNVSRGNKMKAEGFAILAVLKPSGGFVDYFIRPSDIDFIEGMMTGQFEIHLRKPPQKVLISTESREVIERQLEKARGF